MTGADKIIDPYQICGCKAFGRNGLNLAEAVVSEICFLRATVSAGWR